MICPNCNGSGDFCYVCLHNAMNNNLMKVEKGQIWVAPNGILCPVIMVIDDGERIVYEDRDNLRSMTVEGWHKSMTFFAEEN